MAQPLIRELVIITSDGSSKPFLCTLSMPEMNESGVYGVKVVFSDNSGPAVPIMGCDAIQAMELAIRMMEKLLEKVAEHSKLTWPDGSDYFPN